MKYLLIFLLVFGLVALYAYYRLRPYIRLARQIFGAARGAGRVIDLGRGSAQVPPRDAPARPTGEPLVRCASCGTWLPSSRAVSLGRKGPQFCSHACLERSADSTRRGQKTAS